MEAIECRRSIREFSNAPVEPEKLAKIAEAFRLAPSARNLQNWKLLIVTDPAVKERIREAQPGKHEMLSKAPVILVGTCNSQEIMTNSHRIDSVDVSIAMSFAMLQAQELGLGTCWMAYYTEPEMKTALNLPESTSIVAIMPLGYPNEKPEARPRKNINDIVEYI